MTNSTIVYPPRTPTEPWVKTPLKYLAELSNGYVFSSQDWSAEGTPIIRIENLNGSQDFNHSTISIADRHHVTEGDLLFSWSGNPGTSFGPFRWDTPGLYFLNQHIFKVTARNCDRNWLYWALSAATHRIERELTSGMIGMVHVTKEELSNFLIAVPPLEEQRRIADFLDTETARIDQMVRLRQKQAFLLGKRFRAIRRNLVTGTREAPQLTQTIGWIGEVPRAWGTPRISHVSRFIAGTTFPHSFQGAEAGDYPFIKVGDFELADGSNHLGQAKNWVSRAVAAELGARIVPPGAVLYARVGAALLLNRRRITTRCSVIDDNVRAIVFRRGDPRYWANLLSFLDMGQLVNPGPVPSISESQVASLHVPCPPDATQEAIANELEKEKLLQRRLEGAMNLQLAKLAERRQALITAAVTGQFDVSSASGRGVDLA
ncbi:restriction endonuclease subunit S [Streptomyces sp. NPDC048172]|uniref:restriction endonuclease subunit S n=1 Tax=Streptomyces sp. NPDC048172 TaxID=3365505 RepID=UPI003713CDCE